MLTGATAGAEGLPAQFAERLDRDALDRQDEPVMPLGRQSDREQCVGDRRAGDAGSMTTASASRASSTGP